eukprot:343596-Chlamydomonas_euryale.AAC.5
MSECEEPRPGPAFPLLPSVAQTLSWTSSWHRGRYWPAGQKRTQLCCSLPSLPSRVSHKPLHGRAHGTNVTRSSDRAAKPNAVKWIGQSTGQVDKTKHRSNPRSSGARGPPMRTHTGLQVPSPLMHKALSYSCTNTHTRMVPCLLSSLPFLCFLRSRCLCYSTLPGTYARPSSATGPVPQRPAPQLCAVVVDGVYMRMFVFLSTCKSMGSLCELDGQMNEWMDGWMDGWVGGRDGGQMLGLESPTRAVAHTCC